MSETLLKVENLKTHFPVKGGVFRSVKRYVKAVDDVSFEVAEGKTFGLVGESGCGKTTLGRSVLQLIPPTSGKVFFEGEQIVGKSRNELLPIRRNMQIIFQDPYASLNPRMTILEAIQEPMLIHRIGSANERHDRVVELLELVGLRRNILNRYPHEFSGGQRQRIGVARALAVNPRFIVADEPVSALDVSVQSQVLNLISDLQQKLGLAFLFISHDLAVVQHVSHEVGVMYLGKIVERASVEEIYQNPKHPYTQALLSAIPSPEVGASKNRIFLPGDVPSPMSPPGGCPFHPRCPVAEDRCRSVIPETVNLKSAADGHWVSCHLYPSKD